MKLLLTFLCLIVQLAYSQGNQKKTPEQSITESDINKEIRKAQELSSKDIKQTLQLSKDAYQQSKKLGYTKGIVESSNIMITKYYDMGRYKDVIELGKESEKYAVDISNYEVLSNIYLLIGLSYTDLGFNDESLKSFKKALKVAEKINSKNHQFYKKSLIYNGLASHSAHINAPIDSVVYYQKKTLETILRVNNDQEYLDRKNSTLALAYINLGKTSNALHQTKDSEIYFSKALEILQDKNYIGNKFLEVSVYNEFAWLYYDQKKYPQSIMYAGKGEELEKQISSPYLRRDIYEVMFKSYVDAGQKERSSEYMNLFTKLNDSIENAENISINTPIKVITDEQTLVHNNDIHKTWIIVLGGILILAILTWFLWRKNQNHLHKKYRNIINLLKLKKMTEIYLMKIQAPIKTLLIIKSLPLQIIPLIFY